MKEDSKAYKRYLSPKHYWRLWRHWRTDPFRRRLSIAEGMIIVLTLVIAIIGGIQAFIYEQQKIIMEAPNNQTGELIKAANINACAARQIAEASKRNATAAEKFEKDAGLINTGVGNAVKKLGAQAVGIENARKTSLADSKAALDAANQAMYLEQRPWVGIEIVPATPPPGMIATAPGIGVVSYVIVAHNSGKTPAIGFRSECCEFETKEFDEVLPTYSVLHADIDRHISDTMRQRIANRTETLEQARDWIRQTRAWEATAEYESKVIAPGGFQQVQNSIQTQGNDHKFHYTLGQFVYKDVLDPSKEHVTQFCVVTVGNSGNLRLCRTSNDMN